MVPAVALDPRDLILRHPPGAVNLQPALAAQARHGIAHATADEGPARLGLHIEIMVIGMDKEDAACGPAFEFVRPAFRRR